HSLFIFSLRTCPPPRSTLFPYTTLFRSPVQDAPRPTCNRCQATYVKNEELQAYLKRVPPATMVADQQVRAINVGKSNVDIGVVRSEEHTSELQSRFDLVCRLLLEKKKTT